MVIETKSFPIELTWVMQEKLWNKLYFEEGECVREHIPTVTLSSVNN